MQKMTRLEHSTTNIQLSVIMHQHNLFHNCTDLKKAFDKVWQQFLGSFNLEEGLLEGHPATIQELQQRSPPDRQQLANFNSGSAVLLDRQQLANFNSGSAVLLHRQQSANFRALPTDT